MLTGGEPEHAKGLDVLWLCTVVCICACGEMQMLERKNVHLAKISTGRGECVPSTDGVAMDIG